MGKVKTLIDVLDFLYNPRRDIEVFGMFGPGDFGIHGPGNLGDEAMIYAARHALPEARLTRRQTFPNWPRLEARIRARGRDHLLVSGGTLIHGGETHWLDYVERRAGQGGQIGVFGTGIAFTPDQIATRSPAYDRWSALLQASPNVYLRGPHSVETCRQMGAEAEIFGDFCFLLFDRDLIAATPAERSETIGLNVGECLGDQVLFEAACVEIVKKLAPRHRLVFHVVVATDIPATERIIAAAGLNEDQINIEYHYFDPWAFMASVRTYHAFIGLKLHAAGLAMVAGVPSLMMAYLPKCRDFMAPFEGGDAFLVDLPLEVEDVMGRLDTVTQDGQTGALVNQIEEISQRQKETLNRVYST